MNINIHIDKSKVEGSFKKLVRDIQTKANQPLKESAQVLVDESIRNFGTQGFTFGEAWKPLKPSTVRARRRFGLGARPILVVTGRLKKGVKIKQVTNTKATVGNDVKYYPYHQLGTRKMPQRQILKETDKAKEAIVKIFNNWVNRLIRGL